MFVKNELFGLIIDFDIKSACFPRIATAKILKDNNTVCQNATYSYCFVYFMEWFKLKDFTVAIKLKFYPTSKKENNSKSIKLL